MNLREKHLLWVKKWCSTEYSHTIEGQREYEWRTYLAGYVQAVIDAQALRDVSICPTPDPKSGTF